MTAPSSQFATYEFSGRLATPGHESADGEVISGSYTLDTAQPMGGDPVTGIYNFDNSPGHFGLHMSVGPVLFVTAELDSRTQGSWISTQLDGYTVTADQMNVEGTFVGGSHIELNLFGGSGPPASLASLPDDLASFANAFINIQLGDAMMTARVTSLQRSGP